MKKAALAAAIARALAIAGSASVPLTLKAAEVPVPCSAGSCGASGPASWVTSGAASAAVSGNNLAVHQTSANATLNWRSFNISSDASVRFEQPDASSVALNRIYQADPSRIFGSLSANGTVFLLNQNGILFGQGAKVNVGGLVASTLDITPQAVEKGIAGAVSASAPAFASYKDASGAELPSGSVLIESGAKIATVEGGQVLMFAPEVVNRGTITTPGGQTVLAAGTSVYLANSSDSNLRGLLVEVGVGGTVTNGDGSDNTSLATAAGQIVAERGNVTLAGLAVNQLGRITATTSVRQNGSVRLQARDQTQALPQSDGSVKLVPSNGGTLQLGRGSVTEALLADADDTTVDANAQPVSRLELEARDIQILDGARLTARGGQIEIVARSNPAATVEQFQSATPDDSRVYVAAGAVLDVAGASVDLPVERNVVRAELRGNQLADSPLQREGALRSKAVFVDLRKSGTRADGTTWEGTQFANVSGDIATVARGVAERSLSAGNVSITSQGAVIVAPGATVDVSGGQINYQDGYVKTTQLMGTDGKVYDISEADPNRSYIGILGDTKIDHQRWGVTETFSGFPGLGGLGTFERGYVEGKDAGTLAISAPGAVVDGNVIGNIRVGRLQRNPTSATVDGGRLYRDHDEIPAGARLVIGASGKATASAPDFLVGDVTFHNGLVFPGLQNDSGGAFDPLTDLLPSTLTSVNLRPELFGENRVSRTSLFANGTVRLEHGETIALPAGGTLQAISGRVEIRGLVEAAAGNISLTSEETFATAIADSGIELAAGARLSARGQWVNDEPQLTRPATFPALWIDGGTIALTAKQGSLDLAGETLLDVSAGAWARPNGTLAGGRGGNIRLSATPVLFGQPLDVQLGAELRAYALSKGGSLQLTLGAACIAATDCTGGDPTTTWLSPEFFSRGGFSSYAVTTNNGALTLAADTAIDLQQRNLELVGAARRNPTGTDLASFTRIVLLPDEVRGPTSLKLAAELASSNDPVTKDSFPDLPGLELGSRSVIDADPLAAIALRSNSSIVVDGVVRAPGGRIDVQLDASLSGVAEFLPSQGVWLGANGALDVSGVARLIPNDLGFRQGDVLAGGTVEVVASRGFFAAHPSSRIVADGAAAILDVGADRVVGSTRTSVASAGGEISITSAEGMLLSGRLSAASGGGQALGGTLSLRLDPNERGSDPGELDSAFSTAPRAVVLTQMAGALAVSPGTNLSALLGQAVVAANQVREGGFAALDLSAGTLDARANRVQVRVPGEVRFDGDVSLVLPRRITLDAAYLSGSGSVRLDASYVAIGNADRVRQLQVEPNVEIGGSFAAHGSLIELIGNTSIAGFGSVSLESAGDLRARGIQGVTERSIRGSLWTNADLTLRASQVYTTTLSDFGFAIRNNADGVLQVLGNGGARGDVLSAGSRLALSAPTVVNSGVLRAPLGEIDLHADDLTLEPGSIVSTATAGLTIPFGSTQGGLDWVYDLFDAQSLVFGGATGSLAPPQQRISLAATNVDIRQGATLDTSGGGDLLSYEFVPGPGGTRDVLSTQVSPNEFAVVPALNLQFAPYDQREYAGSPLQVGDNVHLSGGSGLPEGDYVLLPARYSLLPGAFLVHRVAGYQDILPGESFAQLDGSTIVSGIRKVAGTGFADARTGGFAVAPASRARLQANYTTTRDNSFFARASADGDPSPFRIANDAGSVVLQADSTLALNGSLLAKSVAGGRGAAVDIAGERLVVGAAGTAVEPGEVLLDAASLNQLGAESLFIGGARTAAATDTRLDLVARAVTIGEGSSLHAPEIIVGGQEQVTVESGASLSGSGLFAGAPVRYSTVGDGAVLRVSGGDDVPFARAGTAGATGQLTLEPGTTLAANGGAIALDATAGVHSEAQLQARAGTLRVGADRIVITDGTVSGSGLVLRPELLTDLHLDRLVLSSRSTVDVGSDLDFALNALSIEAGGINALVPDLSAAISVAGEMKLSNPLALPANQSTASGSRLALHAQDIVIGDNTFGFSGFESTVLRADDRLTAEGTAGLAASGGLDLVTLRVTADVGANLTVTAADVLRLLPAASAATASVASDVSDHIGVGAHIALRGARVEASSLVEAHGGSVTLESLGQGATSGVQIGAGGVIDVTGLEKSYDGVAQTIPGGDVELRAAAGDVVLGAGSRLDVSGAPGGDAGRLALIAHAGHVDVLGGIFGTAGAGGARDGSVHVDAGEVDQLGSLAAQLLSGGFTDEIYLRQRGAGNLIFGPADPLRGHAVTLIADNGIAGVTNLDARGESGGAVRLVGRDGVIVGGNVDASATSAEGRGGSIELSSSTGGVVLLGSAVLNVSAGAGTTGVAPAAGKINLRIPQTVLLQALAAGPGQTVVSLGGQIVGSGRTALEGFTTYDNAGQLLAADLIANVSNPLFGDATTFMQNGPALAALLGRTDDLAFHVVPGVEIRSAGDLTLAADWNLFPWRFGGEPGVLTLRAGGNLLLNRSLSDGFQLLTGANGFALPATPGASWSYRLVAGADGSSADTLAVLGLDELAATGGSVRIATGIVSPTTSTFRMVRTGTGTIDVAAARDFSLGNQASVLYTAGVASTGIRFTSFGQLGGRTYPVNGGDISISAGGDIVGATSNQLVTDWLFRVGRQAQGTDAGVARGWTVNFQRFEQNIGALAGGNVTVRAGGNVDNLSVSIPTIGRQVGSNRATNDILQVIGGGDLTVEATGSIRGGKYYVGSGAGVLDAGVEVAALADGSGTEPIYPVVALGDARFSVTARDSLGVDGAVDPFLLPQGRTQNPGLVDESFYSQYTDRSAVSLLSVAGDVTLLHSSALNAQIEGSFIRGLSGRDIGLMVYAPSLTATSFARDLRLASPVSLFPSPVGNVNLFADRDVLVSPAASLLLSDVDPALLPTLAAPQTGISVAAGALVSSSSSPFVHAEVPVHDASRRGGATEAPARVVSRTGDVAMTVHGLGDTTLLSFAKPARIIAARDLLDIGLIAQNLNETDVTSLVAGRDVRYSVNRGDNGRVLPSLRELSIDGPGDFQIQAGRNIDLQTSSGISTRGNISNLSLAPTGASVSLLAGVGSQAPDYAGFAAKYFKPDSAYASELTAFVREVTGQSGLGFDAAVAQFSGLDSALRRKLIERVFFEELRAAGRDAAVSPTSDFTRAFAALTTLFPGSNPPPDTGPLAAGAANPYVGDIRLYFSRAYTLDGGDISLFAPGGEVNVGLAAPPTAFGINKPASQLGLVAQSSGSISSLSFRDFEVNESRVFAADGGDILVWATEGDIDAGRGAKTAISAPPPTINVDSNGRVQLSFPAALTGSGIQTLATSEGRKPGNVDLFAPRGVVNAGDAGIVAGNLTIAATAVLGADNISVSGVSVGVPVDTGGFAAALTGVSAVASSATSAAEDTVAANRQDQASATPLAEAALSFLDVFVTGFGDGTQNNDKDEDDKDN